MINRVYKATVIHPSGRDRIQKGDEVTPIKYGTFHYAATAGNPSLYGKGGAFSSYIEFEYYVSGGVTLNKGDMLLYEQEWDTDTSFVDITPSREQGINVYYVKEIKEKRETNYILAYDMIEALLDVDFSETLKANEANFPMTIESLCLLVYTLTGVRAPWWEIVLSPPDRTNYWKQAKVNYFYSPGITARNIYNWIGEIIGQKLLYLWSGEMAVIGTSKHTTYKTFTNNENQSCGWRLADKYAVCPGDGTYTVNGNTAINAWYKENGLEIGKAFPTYDGVEIVASSGALLGSYYTATPATNVLRIVGNMIAENIAEFSTFKPETIPPTYGTYNDLAQDILAGANVVSGMNYAKVQLFPFRCPYTIGSRMYCFDSDGNQYIVPIMSIDLTEDGVTIGAYGGAAESDINSYSGGESYDNASQIATLWAKVNQLEALMPTSFRVTTVSGTTNQYGNIATGLGADCSILSIRRTDRTSICVALWGTAGNVEWYAHVMGNTAAAVTNTNVTLEIVYIQGVFTSVYNLTDGNGNQLTDHNGNPLVTTA